MLRRLAGSLALLAALSVAQGCTDEGTETRDYVDGQSQLTDDGAFTATLYHTDGAPMVGANDFELRVAVPTSELENDDGRGVPRAVIIVHAEMLDQDYRMNAVPKVQYEGDGVYELEGIVLDRAGEWSLDFDIIVGDIHERATFDFVVEG